MDGQLYISIYLPPFQHHHHPHHHLKMSGQLYIYKSHRFPTALPSPSRQWGQGWKKFYLLSFYWDFTLACIYPLKGANHFRFSSRSAPKTIEYDWIRILQRFPISDRVSRTWQWIEPKEPQRCNCETDKSKWNGPNGQIHDEAAGSLLRRIDEQQVIINDREGELHRLSDCLMKCLKCMKTFIASWIWFSWLVYELLIKNMQKSTKKMPLDWWLWHEGTSIGDTLCKSKCTEQRAQCKRKT